MESLLANKLSKVNSILDRLVGSGFSCSLELWEFEQAQHSHYTDGGHGAQKGHLFSGPSGGGTRTQLSLFQSRPRACSADPHELSLLLTWHRS